MSKFFKCTHDEKLILDDNSIDVNRIWSSDKIFREIIKHRLNRLEQLIDVDVTNKKDKQVLAYSADTDKFTTVDAEAVGNGGGNKIEQVCKMGVVASPETPHTVNISINTLDFKVPRVNLLKYELGEQDIIVSKNKFTNGESNDFIKDDMIVFDGKAHLKTEYSNDYIVTNDTELFTEYEAELDFSEYKTINKFEDFEDGLIKKIKIKATPYDRLLIPVGDMNLSNVKHIDYFKITAIGKNLKIVCSVDSGKTWKTFRTDKWLDIDLSVKNLSTNGIDIETFNKINDTFWNQLVTTHKIRFAYLLRMDDIKDIEELSDLTLKYDSEGKWIQAKEDTFDVIYVSNTLLQVLVKFSGDIKINY